MNQKPIAKSLLVMSLLIASSFAACDEFIERSLDNQAVNLVSPGENIETSMYQLTFTWDANPDALHYRLQIATKSFTNIERMLLDTLVKKDKFTYTLDPDNYQWRVRAENGSSQTPYTTQSFTVHPSSLTNNVIQLTSPANNFFTSSPDVKLEWLNLFGATQYRVQLDNQNFIDENNLVLNAATTNLSFLKTLSKEGNYQFRVRGESTTESSKWSVVRNFSYDATPPVQVKLTAPLNNKTVAKPVQLTWDSITDAEKYELIVYQSDLTTLYNTSYPMILTTNTYTFNAGESNEVIGWKVRAIDKSGNKGSFRDLFSFTIQ